MNDEDDYDNSNNKGAAHLCTACKVVFTDCVCVQHVCVCEPHWVW